MPKVRRGAGAFDAGDFDRVVFRREGELLAPARGAGRPFGDAVDVNDEIPIALPCEATDIASLAVVPGRAAGPDRRTLIAIICKCLVRTLGVRSA